MIKKFISVLLATALLMVSLGCSFVVFAANSVSVDSFVESVSELNEEAAEEEKTLEESAGSRVVVKALQKPETYGKADYFKGTRGKHIYQYATEDEALKAVKYYNSLSTVSWAARDQIATAQEVSYAEAMLGTQRAKEIITNKEIPTASVKVAVLDTGIDFANIVFKDNPRIVDSGVNVTDSGATNSALDDKGHGSMVSEIIMDNTSLDVSVIGYKVLNKNGAGTNLWIATAIEKAVEDGANVINMSLGGEKEPINADTSIVLDDAVRFAISEGVIIVASSGNDGINANAISPAYVEGVITVGAIDKAGNKAYFSNYGNCVDFVAPGVQIERDYVMATYYTYENGNKITHSDDGAPVDGTSFSSPYIAAEVGTVLSVFPDLTRDEVVEKLKSVCLTFDDLHYHDGFHPINEDRGQYIFSTSLYLTCESYDDNSVCYGNGMPQLDLLFEFPDGFERAASPDFSLDSGHYVDEEFDLIISSEPSAEVYYTQDESYPTKENGIKYVGAVHLDELQSFRAVAFCDGKAPSRFSAREYRFEYHVPESDFTFEKKVRKFSIDYTNVITSYNGTKKNIIYPESIDGNPVNSVFLYHPNVELSSITLPDCCNTFMAFASKPHTELKVLTGSGVMKISVSGKYFPALVELNVLNAKRIAIPNSNVRKLNCPKAISIDAENAYCLKEVYAPNLKLVCYYTTDELSQQIYKTGGFKNCYSLSDLYAPNLEFVGDKGFDHCTKLKSITTESIQEIGLNSFAGTYCLNELICPNLTIIKDIEPFANSRIHYLYAPKLKTMSHLIGYFNRPSFVSTMIVSSEFTHCDRDAEGYDYDPLMQETYFYHHNLDIYGTPNTYAEEYANKFHLKFIPLPLMESEPESMRASDNLSVDVLGFNLEYQWFGTNIADNRLGEAIEGANGETLNPDDFGADYDFYYCVIKSSDGDYHKTLVTGDRIRLDVNGDGVIDIADISLLLSMYGEAPAEPFQDFNGDGVINVSEISLLLKSTVYGTEE